jgi:hypothetical protein
MPGPTMSDVIRCQWQLKLDILLARSGDANKAKAAPLTNWKKSEDG